MLIKTALNCTVFSTQSTKICQAKVANEIYCYDLFSPKSFKVANEVSCEVAIAYSLKRDTIIFCCFFFNATSSFEQFLEATTVWLLTSRLKNHQSKTYGTLLKKEGQNHK